MPKIAIGLGSTANDGTGDTLRVAGGKINDNFSEIYTAIGNGSSITLTSTPTELNILAGALLSTTELNYVDGVTSSIQTQLNAKSPTAGSSSITTLGTIATGVWNGTAIGAAYGGTGVANNAAATVTSSGNFAYTRTLTATTNVTFPTTGTLATLSGTETLTNKTLNSTTISSGSLTFSGNISSAAWTTSGIRHVSVPATLTDTTSSGTVANAYTNNFGGNTIAATSATTFTNYGTVFINNPTAGTNVTITNPYSLITSGNILVGSTGTAALTAGTVTATAATATAASTASSLGYLGIPQNSKSSTYTTVIGDAGKHIYVTSTATITIDSNDNVAYPIGTTIGFIAASGATVTIAITSDTMYLGGTGTTGSRTLAAFGMATAVKVDATIWFISGFGLT